MLLNKTLVERLDVEQWQVAGMATTTGARLCQKSRNQIEHCVLLIVLDSYRTQQARQKQHAGGISVTDLRILST